MSALPRSVVSCPKSSTSDSRSRFSERTKAGQDGVERKRKEHLSAQQSRAAAEHLQILHGETIHAEVGGGGQRQRTAVEQDPAEVNIAGRISCRQLAIERHRVEVTGEADQFERGHAGVRRAGAVAVPKKEHAAFAGPVGREGPERLEIARNLAHARLETPLVGQRVLVTQGDLPAAAGEVRSALRLEAGHLEVATLELEVGLHRARRYATRAQVPSAHLEPSLAIGGLAGTAAFDTEPAGELVPWRPEQPRQSAEIADVRIDVEFEGRPAPVRSRGRQGERAAQLDLVGFLPQVAFVEPDAPAGDAQSGGELLDCIFAPSKIFGLDAQGHLAGQRLGGVAVEGQFGEIDCPRHLALDAAESSQIGQGQIERIDRRF